MELFGRNKNRRKGKEKTRKEKNVTETYGKSVEIARIVEEWERKEKELTRKGWKDIEYGGMICQKSPDWLEPRGGNSI